ncbi:hypothetical protein BSIN_5394 [Burkholderia singularis]|uniref:Uncharacterized protein n=1 Tax=Burkholderia singularis TaxID=1503053 RepID=A0A238HC27_9BURK|nr:hypothetical protein BSIN_5394 [Burkholderia singularis]
MNGTQRVRPGERVKAHLVPMTGGDDAAAAAAAPASGAAQQRAQNAQSNARA